MQVLTAVRGAIARGRVRHAGALSALALLAACATPPAPPPGAPPTSGEVASSLCRASEAQAAVGGAYTEELGATLQAKAGAKVLRVIKPGQAVTMDFREDRLNVELDAAGKVKRVTCG